MVRTILALALTTLTCVAHADLIEFDNPAAIAAEIGLSQVNSRLTAEEHHSRRLQIYIDKAASGREAGAGLYETAQTMQVYLDGQMIHNFAVSTGKEKLVYPPNRNPYRAVTPVGTFGITRRYKKYTSVTWKAPMPFAQFFNGGIAIHATTPNHYHELGARASGGCVRLHFEDAKTLWMLVDQVGVENVSITVYDSSRP